MDAVMVIGGSVVLVTFFGGLFDYLGKKAKGGSKETQARLDAIEQRLAEQDQAATDRDEQLRRLQGEVVFMTRLLEDRSHEKANLPDA